MFKKAYNNDLGNRVLMVNVYLLFIKDGYGYSYMKIYQEDRKPERPWNCSQLLTFGD